MATDQLITEYQNTITNPEFIKTCAEAVEKMGVTKAQWEQDKSFFLHMFYIQFINKK